MKITALIPVYNEERYIQTCLESIIANNEPDLAEIYVIDGLSTDRTVEIVEEMRKEYPMIKLLKNPNKTVPYALNIGIKHAIGDHILRLDAHSYYPEDYISLCKKAITITGADNVGGVFITHQNGDSLSAKLVQMVSTHIFGVGDAQFRLQPAPHFTDTVPFGFFKKSIFEKIGYFDERLTRNQDYEFNARIKKSGGKIWLDPRIRANYKNQSRIKGLLRQAVFTGKWNVWMWKVAPYSFKPRHLIPGIFTCGFSFLFIFSRFNNGFAGLLKKMLAFYGGFSVIASYQQTNRYNFPLGLIFLPWIFFLYHFSYGLGILKGIYLLLRGQSEVEQHTRPWEGALHYKAVESWRIQKNS